VATSQSPVATRAEAAPPTTPVSKPISATHGVNAIAPSVADHENASISPHVAARPADATNVTTYLRLALDTRLSV
jgi:hypothetical protein